MQKYIIGSLLVVLGVLIAFPLFSIGYYTMIRTSTPQFCASCHEIQFAYNTWKTSTHVNNAQGFVADCMDCHLPAPHDTFEFFYAKTFHGITSSGFCSARSVKRAKPFTAFFRNVQNAGVSISSQVCASICTSCHGPRRFLHRTRGSFP